MLNKQETYWLDCWRRSRTVDPATLSRLQRRNCWGAMTHGLYAARVLNEEEELLLAEWADVLAGLRADYPGEEDRVEIITVYLLFFVRAMRADKIDALARAGHAIRFHLRRLQHPKPAATAARSQADAQREFIQALLAAAERRFGIAGNAGQDDTAHA